VTAPLTPHDHDQAAWPQHVGEPAPERADVSILRAARLNALVAVVFGVALGLLWLWLAPRVPVYANDGAVYLQDAEGEQVAGIDGTFMLLSLALGVISAILVFWRFRTGGVAVVIGLAAGSLLGAVIGWRLGIWLGPEDLVSQAKAVGNNKVFDAPLELHAKGALLVWPIASTLAHLGITTAFGPRDPEPLPDWDHPEPSDTPPQA
jgi:hypothetical protein